MSLKDWRKRRSMRDPVRGEFQVTDRYCAHPGSRSSRETLTGVVTGPGVPATPGEQLADGAGRWAGHHVLPALVDRSDPTSFVILWGQLPKPAPRPGARHEATGAAAQIPADAAGTGRASRREPGPSDTPDQGGAPAADAAPEEGGAPSPDWVRGVLADVLPNLLASGGPSVIIDGGAQIIDLAGGQPPAAGAGTAEPGGPATAEPQDTGSDTDSD